MLKRKYSLLISSLFLSGAVILVGMPLAANAARTVLSATLNGATSVAVNGGATVSAKVTVQTTGFGWAGDWISTGWRIAASPGAFACVNTGLRLSAGTYSASFNVKAPTSTGTYNAYFVAYSGMNCTSVSNAGPSATFTLNNAVTVGTVTPPPPALTINPSALPNGTVGVAYTQTLTASTTAAGPFTWSIASGSLPSGLSLGTSTSATDKISGTPTTNATSTFSVKATNGTSSSTQSYTVNIAITASGTLPTATLSATDITTGKTISDTNGTTKPTLTVNVGDTIKYTWSSSNGSSYSSNFTIAPASPPWSCFWGSSGGWVANNAGMSTSGIIPTCEAGYAATINYTVTGLGGSATATIIMPVPVPLAALTINNATSGSFTVGQTVTYAVTSNIPSTNFSIDYTLNGVAQPPLLNYSSTDANGNWSMQQKLLSSYVGTYDEQYVFSNLSSTTSNHITFTVSAAPAPSPALTINPSTLPNGTVGVAYSQTLTASTTAAGPFTWSIASGSLPSGLSLGTSTSATDKISGTPTTNATSTFSVKATNGTSSSTQSYTVNIAAAVPPPPPPTNLILNPDLANATVSSTVPDHWSHGGYGTNTATYTYPVAGPNGTDKAEKVAISSYTNGDATWVFDNVPVTPNATYVFSDWYNSTATTEIDALWTLTNGGTAANYISGFGPTSGWASTTQQVVAPANAASVTIYHLIAGVGSLSTAHYSLAPLGSSTADLFPQGLVSLTFDDGWQSQFNNAVPILNAAGMHATFYIISDAMAGNEGNDYMNASTVLALQKTYGEEIGDHTVFHCDLLTGLCPDGDPPNSPDPLSANQEIGNARTALLAIGVSPVDTFAYPYGDGSGNSIVEADLTANGIVAARSVNVGYNFTVTNRLELKIQSVDATVTTSTIHSWIDYAAQNKVWLTLMLHQIETSTSALASEPEGTTKAVLQDTVAYLQSKQGTGTGQILVKTVHDVVSNYMH